MRRFRNNFNVQASLDAVVEFHNDSRALKMLTPPPVFVQLNQVEPIDEGSVADFTMWIGPIPVHWMAKHTEVNPSVGFVDYQVEGPFLHWQHRHSFIKIDDHTTEVVDEVEAIFGEHPFWGLVSRLMWVNLPLLFAYRGWATKRALEKRKR
jgi:ligand-binding SRPBCC domain-containing protein